MKKGKSICVFSTKGGVGKSTTVINMAGVFSRLSKKTLVIDFDNTSGSIATYLHIFPNKNVANCEADHIGHAFGPIEQYVTKYNEYIDVLPACKDPRVGSKLDVNIASLILEKALYSYDYILIDMNHFLNEMNLTIIDNVDLCLLVMSNDLIDIKNTANLVTIFKDADKNNYRVLLNESINPDRKYYSLFDIKNAIKTNIDYYIDSSFYLKSIDSYISDGQILTLQEKMPKYYPIIYKAYEALINDIMEVSDER